MRTLTSLLAVAVLATTAHAEPFAGKLHARLPAGNLVYSPASISIALAMTREGAVAETATELDAALGKGALAAAKSLDKSLRGRSELAIANRLFGEQSLAFEKPFIAVTRDGYDAPLEGLDFRTRSEDARVQINKWVEERTAGKIRDLLPERSLDKLTRLVLVNAIYFKADWVKQFDKGATRPAAFTVDDKTTKQVPTMHGDVTGKVGKYAGATLLDLPYKSSKLSLLVVVPDKQTKLADIESRYAKEGLARFLAALPKAAGEVDVALPKFRVETTLALAETLAAMGVKRAFTKEAQFDAISKIKPLFISKVIHKAVIDVNEAGTEAAAATAVVMSTDGGGPPNRVKVDRAFAYFLHDEAGNVLFAGRVVDPTRQ